jgi:hypothetical protein
MDSVVKRAIIKPTAILKRTERNLKPLKIWFG